MSLADDKSLLAMKAARMSTGSIAFTMGWSDRRVERRLAELEAAAKAEATEPVQQLLVGSLVQAVAVPTRPVTPERPPHAVPVRIPEPRPRPVKAGEGLVTRTFALTSGGRGAAVLLPDARLVFTETGHQRPDLGDHVPVVPADGCFRMEDGARG